MAGTAYSWTTAGSSVWTLGTNWSPVGPPTGADTALIPLGSALINSGIVTIADVSIGGSLTAPASGKGTVAVLSGAAFHVADALWLWSGSMLSVDATSSVDIGASGTAVAGAVVIESGHTLSGDGSIAASIVNSGTILVLGTVASNVFTRGTMEITGPITGSGSIVLAGTNAILQVDGPISAGQTIDFGNGTELIVNAPGTAFSAPIINLSTGDKIEFAGLQVKSASLTAPGTITVITSSGSYQLTNVGFAAGASTQLFTGIDTANGDSFIQVAPPFINWLGGSGDFATGANWQGGVAPNSTQSASFLNNPGTITGSGNALSLNIGFSNSTTVQTWTFSGTTINVIGQPSAPFLPYAIGFSANTVLNGATLNAAGGSTNIGNLTGVTVTAQGGSHILTGGDSLGNGPGQAGSLLVSGPGTSWTEQVSPPLNGNTFGFLNVGFTGDGNGSDGAAGFVTVSNGATLNTQAVAALGFNAGASGTVTVSSSGVWTNNGVNVGFNGSGKLSINGGTVTSTGASTFGTSAGGSGNATIDGSGTWSAQGLTVGNSGVGVLAVNSGLLTTSGNLIVGQANDGNLTINSGGIIRANGTFDAVGNNAGATGSLTINNGGTLVTAGQQLNVGNNAGSSGSLIINAGGTLLSTLAPQTTFWAVGIGVGGSTAALPGANGTAVVTGVGALLDTNGNPLRIGHSTGATGSLLVASGGSVVVGTPNTNDFSALGIASLGGTGNLTITDAGSSLTANGFVQMGRGGAGSLLIQNNASMTVNDDPLGGGGMQIGAGRGAGPTAPNNVGGSGVAAVTAGGVLHINSTTSGLTVGGNGDNGILNVNNAGTVLTGSGMTVGVATFAGGTLYGGDGVVNIGAGGVVRVSRAATTSQVVNIGNANTSVAGPTAAASGLVTVSGPGALLDTNGSGLAVGSLSSGSLIISQGGSVAAASPDSTQALALQVGQLGSGSVLVADVGSQLSLAGSDSIGRAGTGRLTVQNGGLVTVAPDGAGNVAASNFAIGGAGIFNGTTAWTGGSGYAVVTDNGTISAQVNILVGRNAATGSLTVDSGGNVETTQQFLIGNTNTYTADGKRITVNGVADVANGTALPGIGSVSVGAGGVIKADGSGNAVGASTFVIGNGAGATGSLNVVGAGAQVISIGQMAVGRLGTGQLSIQNQATVTTGNSTTDAGAGFDIGAEAGGSGSAVVTGANSLLTNTGRFIVGDNGVGSLSIQSGGTVITTAGTVAGLAGASIAAHTGAGGSSVDVIGAGSNWQVGGALLIGDAAHGLLSIAADGDVSAASAAIGVQSGASGLVSVVGNGSNLTLSGSLIVGDAASAGLSILNGATVTATDADIGLGAAATGNVDIEGANSHLNIAHDLNIGVAGAGVLTLGQGTELTVVNNLNVGTNGILNSLGGVIDPAVFTNTGRAGGNGTISASVSIVNTGTLFAANGTETLVAPVITGKGALEINTKGNLFLNVGSVAATQTVTFTDATGVLTLGTVAGFAATISTFEDGDQIFLQGTSIVSNSFDPATHVLTLYDASHAPLGSLNIGNGVDPSLLVINSAGGIGKPPPCFLAGTRISTERGEVAVEDLCVGDQVQLAAGRRSEPIVWIGHRRLDCTRHPEPRKIWPVCIAAHAFGTNRPYRDLFLSPNHAVSIGDVLIPAKYLINDSTIRQIPVDEVSYYHVELPQHSVLLAEGLPSESYLDTGDRSNFTNGSIVTLHPDFASRVWEAEACAPLVVSGVELEATRRWVNSIAGRAKQVA